jgi:L-amino acid N-acyltransferase YncA
MSFIRSWFEEHQGRYSVLVAEIDSQIVGWASLNRYSHRCAYNGVADLSVYVDRSFRGKGIGTVLLKELEKEAKTNGFHKMVLFTFLFNKLGQRLYRKKGFREVGVFEKQGRLDGRFVDVMAMEKLL